MLKRMSIVALGAILAVAIAPSAFAADLTYNLVYAGSTEADFVTPTVYTLDQGGGVPAGAIDPTHIHRFEYRFTIASAAADEALNFLQSTVSGAGVVGVAYDSSLVPLSAWDPPPPGAGGGASRALWQLFDAGTDGDLVGLTAITDAINDWRGAYRYHPGEASGLLGADTYIGDLYLSFTEGNTVGSHSITLSKDAGNGTFLMWTGGNASTATPVAGIADYTANTTPSVFAFTVVPEPATMVLFGLGLPALGLVALRRRKA